MQWKRVQNRRASHRNIKVVWHRVHYRNSAPAAIAARFLRGSSLRHLADACFAAARGKPASPYVAFGAAKEHWHEIPMPAYLHGRTANLALIVDDFPFQ